MFKKGLRTDIRTQFLSSLSELKISKFGIFSPSLAYRHVYLSNYQLLHRCVYMNLYFNHHYEAWDLVRAGKPHFNFVRNMDETQPKPKEEWRNKGEGWTHHEVQRAVSISSKLSSTLLKIFFRTLLSSTRLSYYNVATRLVDLVGLCWLKQNLVKQIC